MKEKKTIAVLAGMGPRSTSPFLEQLLDVYQDETGAINDIEFPHIIIYSLPTPFYVDKEIDDDKMLKSLKYGVKQLEKHSFDVLAVPCNSVQKYFDVIFEAKSYKVPRIAEIVADYISDSNVLLLATRSTINSRVYQKALKENGNEIIISEDIQQIVDGLIKEKKEGLPGNKSWNKLIKIAKQADADRIIIACTDLSEFGDNDYVIDAGKLLAKEIIKIYLKK